MEEKEINYNDEPVFYCKNCLSLNIKTLDGTNIDFCSDCGSVDIGTTHIDIWQNLKDLRDIKSFKHKGVNYGREKQKQKGE